MVYISRKFLRLLYCIWLILKTYCEVRCGCGVRWRSDKHEERVCGLFVSANRFPSSTHYRRVRADVFTEAWIDRMILSNVMDEHTWDDISQSNRSFLKLFVFRCSLFDMQRFHEVNPFWWSVSWILHVFIQILWLNGLFIWADFFSIIYHHFAVFNSIKTIEKLISDLFI